MPPKRKTKKHRPTHSKARDKKVDSEDELNWGDGHNDTGRGMSDTISHSSRQDRSPSPPPRRGRRSRRKRPPTYYSDPGPYVEEYHHHHTSSGPGFLTGYVIGGAGGSRCNSRSPSSTTIINNPAPAPAPAPASSGSFWGGGGGGGGGSSGWGGGGGGGSSTSTSSCGTTSL